MRLLSGALGVLLLLALLTWLLLRGIDTNAPAYAVTLRAFDDFALAEASLHRDVLQARAGLLRDYDTLVKAVEAMQDAVSRLRSHAQTEGLDVGPADRLAATVAQQEELTETLQEQQRALAEFAVLCWPAEHKSRVRRSGRATRTRNRRIGGGAPLSKARHIAGRCQGAARNGSTDLRRKRPLPGRMRKQRGHCSRMPVYLQELLPTVDDTLKALVAAPSRQPLEELRAQFSDRRSAVEATEQRFRLLLYLVSVLLLVMLVHLGLRLRARALALRRRAAFEHVIAENSTRLINCPPAETDARLKQVLGELCRAIGAERAYVVLDENPARVNAVVRGRNGVSAGLAQSGADTVRTARPRPDPMSSPCRMLPLCRTGQLKDMLAAAGVRSWACVPLIRPGRVRGIMGFDTCRPERDRVFPVAGVAPCRRRSGQCARARVSRAATERDSRRAWNGRAACK